MDLGISGKVAIVTAASKGLGLATAQGLAKEGVSVLINGRDPATLAEAAATLSRQGATVLAVPGDILAPETPELLVKSAIERFGRLDIVVANSGGPPVGRALNVSEEALINAYSSNFISAVRIIKQALPEFRRHQWGRVIAITSYSIISPIPTLALSNTSRSALWAWIKTAANDLSKDYPNITINTICPGPHNTERMKEIDHGGSEIRMGDPLDFGKVATFLCSEPAKFVNGAAVVVDGGSTLYL